MKEDNDNAEPAPSSVAAFNLLRLAQIFDAKELRERAQKTIAAFAPSLEHFPSALPQMLVALDNSLTKPKQVVIAGTVAAIRARLLAEVHRHFLPDTIVLLADGAARAEVSGEKLRSCMR